jgi:hypothetical protein
VSLNSAHIPGLAIGLSLKRSDLALTVGAVALKLDRVKVQMSKGCMLNVAIRIDRLFSFRSPTVHFGT